MIDNDDLPVGRVLSRREALAFLGATGALLFLGCSADEAVSGTTPDPDASSCVVKPELTEGPYYVDEELNRSDIRLDPSDGSVRDGALLALTFNVSSAASSACTPLAGARAGAPGRGVGRAAHPRARGVACARGGGGGAGRRGRLRNGRYLD